MKKLFLILFISMFAMCAFAQVSVNPDDVFYKEAQNWELKGLTGTLPQVRPYPVNTIKKILEDVINSGKKQDAELALEEWERIFNKSYHFYAEAAANVKTDKSTYADDSKDDYTEKGGTFEVGLAGDYQFNDKVSITFDLGMYFEKGTYEDYVPYKANKPADSIFDPSAIGPMNLYLDWNTKIAYGTPDIYITGGVSKTGFGPFIGDGLALNDTAYHSNNLVFNVTRENWSYAQVFEAIGATNNYGDATPIADGKFLAFHSLSYNFNKYITIGYYENVIFGPNFNWAFILPAPYMTVQNIGGASNNLQMGILFEVKPMPGVKWSSDVFVDDFDVNEVVKFHLDSKIRVAGQSGIIFAPSDSACTDMSLYYTCILPYVYAHWEYNTGTDNVISGTQYNYQNYLNSGRNIGCNLDPNSDRVTFNVNFRPAKFFKLGVNTAFIRHANSAEAFDEKDRGIYMLAEKGRYTTDGSANMHQMYTDQNKSTGQHISQAWDCLGFMTSDHKMYVCQTGLNGELMGPKTKRGQLSFKFGYTFEWVHNAGVNRNIYEGGIPYTYNSETKKFTLTDTGDEYDSIKAMGRSDYVQNKAQSALDEWVSKLHDEVNQYISFSVKYVY